ncbi:MAG: tetrathionate reductase family octaheme c-type cytochrome [Deltaproteobacteria bacterium]|nr:tetrathionate reductase family octaheme c-type cytochrome [Deltaproteobacteria bacterium]
MQRLNHNVAGVFTAVLSMWAVLCLVSPVFGEDQAPGRTMAQQATRDTTPWITTDHSKHEVLKQTFSSGPQVTKACVSCHSEAETQFHKTIHWTWKGGKDEDGVQMGKAAYSLNNFCISTNMGQDKGCQSCHPGWGKKAEATNCLVCHGSKKINWKESFEDYNAFMADAENDPDLKEMADELQAEIQLAVQSVVRPGRQNCGSCHFNGGGGDGVKHGDLDSSMSKPNKALDVHMGLDGQNFSCVRCHTTRQHNISGRIYTVPAYTDRKSLIEDDLTSKITCESCHSSTPHQAGSKANDHTDKVACQSCHIPTFARVNPTKMFWDWSTSGKTRDGKPYKTEGPYGKHDYMSIKGSMTWEKNQKPEYFWFNGSIRSLSAVDTIDPSGTVALSYPLGDMHDRNARIFPFKVHRGVQPYDKVNKTLLAPLLSGPNGYWKHLDWQKALALGSKALDLPFSGEFDFVHTTYVFPTTHMVAPKENVVNCRECHIREGSRLAGMSGFYMPGRDHWGMLDALGWVMVVGALIAVTLHGLGRVFSSSNGGKKGGK